MVRWALLLLAVSLLLSAVGWMGSGQAWFEIPRLAGLACMTISFALFILNYLLTADPQRN